MTKETMEKEITKVMNWIEVENEKGAFSADKEKVIKMTEYLRKILSDMDKGVEK